MDVFLSLLPEPYRKEIRSSDLQGIVEIRLRVGQPLLLRSFDSEKWILPNVPASMLEELLSRVCGHSAYAHQETLRRGYVTMEGGHRIGISGTVALNCGEVSALVQPSTMVFRVARQVPGCADGVMKSVRNSTLVVGPPCSGKTTLLRDMIRQISDHTGQRVSLVDERGEIAAVLNGVPQMEVGCRTDVLTNIPKGQGLLWAIRALNPQWIAVDEITAPNDIQALEYASYCGVRLLATAHAEDVQDLYRRPLYQRLMEKRIFQSVVVIGKDRSYTIQEV